MGCLILFLDCLNLLLNNFLFRFNLGVLELLFIGNDVGLNDLELFFNGRKFSFGDFLDGGLLCNLRVD